MKQDFNEAINNFIAWHVRKGIIDDVSEEEFKKRLEERKKEIIDNISYFEERMESLSEKDNPFAAIVLLLMLFPSFGNLNKMFEEFLGKKLSKEELNEYLTLSTEKINVENAINFLTEDNKIDESMLSPVMKTFFSLKDKLLPHLKKLEKEVQEKLTKLTENESD